MSLGGDTSALSGVENIGFGGDDFLKQIEGTWRQIKMKTEELQRSQAENARLAGLLDTATAEIASSVTREQEMRSRVVSLTGAVKERDAKLASMAEVATLACFCPSMCVYDTHH